MTLRIVLAQLNLLVGDIVGNLNAIKGAIKTARDELNAQAILFPELSITGYPPEDLLYKPHFLQQVDQALAELAHSAFGIQVIVGFPESVKGTLYNSAAVLQQGTIQAIYRKHELPNYGVFDEVRYFRSGNSPCVFDVAGVQVGLTICEDIWFKSPVAMAKAAGAKLIFNLNASPYEAEKTLDRERVVRERVEETGLPLVYCNLVGGQDELVFDGASFVMDKQGKVVVRAAEFVESLTVAEFELAEDGMVEAKAGAIALEAKPVASVYQALVTGVRDYVLKNGFQGAVLGLSGGIDSALTLALAVDALGADKVEAVMMPSRYTADMSVEDAELEAQALGVDYHVIPIEPAFQAFTSLLAEVFQGLAKDTTEENIQARCRGVLLMAISNKKRKILLTTGNKSEMSVGYATLYGDMAGGFAPLKDVPKLLVYQLSEYRNRLSPVIPQRVIDRPPSAELAPDQKDEDSLPPYDILDPILKRYVEEDLSVEEIIHAGFAEEYVRKVARLVDLNEYKRRQAPPGVKISRRAFGRDRRYPITSGFGRKPKA